MPDVLKVIVDTNVPIVTNGKSIQASAICINSCRNKLQAVMSNSVLVIDNKWRIIKEYKAKLNESGKPGVGDEFLRWILINRNNPDRCEQINITEIAQDEFAEFPNDPALDGFDRSFVAVALIHPDKPPILNAVDSDWFNYEAVLKNYGIKIKFLCPQDIKQITN